MDVDMLSGRAVTGMRYDPFMPTDRLPRSRFPFLAELSATSADRLAAGLRSVELAPGSKVLSRGDEVSGVYLVEGGALRVYYLTPEGREGTLYWIEPGQSCILALNCTFARMPYPAWVEADQGVTRVSIVPGGLYRELHECEPTVQKFTFEALSGRLFDLMLRLEEEKTLGMEERLAALLVRLAGADGEVRLSQERLALHLGTAREVVSRSIRSLARRGLISSSQSLVRIADLEGLVALARKDEPV